MATTQRIATIHLASSPASTCSISQRIHHDAPMTSSLIFCCLVPMPNLAVSSHAPPMQEPQ